MKKVAQRDGGEGQAPSTTPLFCCLRYIHTPAIYCRLFVYHRPQFLTSSPTLTLVRATYISFHLGERRGRRYSPCGKRGMAWRKGSGGVIKEAKENLWRQVAVSSGRNESEKTKRISGINKHRPYRAYNSSKPRISAISAGIKANEQHQRRGGRKKREKNMA